MAVPTTAHGYRHELGIYASDEEFQALICPFVLGGLKDDEPVVLAYDPDKVRLLRRWLPESPNITYLIDAGPYAVPAKALAGWRKVVEKHLAAGSSRVRIAGNVPHPGYGRPYAGWDRYEAAVDRALGDLPVWAPCLYDARIAPAEVLAAATQHHRHLLDRSGTRRVNRSFRPAQRLADFLPPPPEPLERAKPGFEAVDPTPGEVRAAVARLAEEVVTSVQRDDLVLGVSEVVSNAILHGVPPVKVRIWRDEHRVVIHVHDEGAGPTDPLVGLIAGGDSRSATGRGLWLTHMLDIDVALIKGEEGFSVRLRAEAD